MTRFPFFLFIFLLVKFETNSIAGEEAKLIPLTTPKVGEPRPGWWLSCWKDHIVVVEGSIEFTTTKADQVSVDISPEAFEKHYELQKDRELQQKLSLFYIGDLTINKVLFAAPGIESADIMVAQMVSGDRRKAKVLLPTMTLPAPRVGFDIFGLAPRKPNKGVIILQYGSSVLNIPMVYSEMIPKTEIKNAQDVFAYREKFDHIKHPENNR